MAKKLDQQQYKFSMMAMLMQLRPHVPKYHQAKPDNGQKFIFGEVHFSLLQGIKYHKKWSMEFCYQKHKKAYFILHTVFIYITKTNSPTIFWLSHCKTIDSIVMIASPIEKSHF